MQTAFFLLALAALEESQIQKLGSPIFREREAASLAIGKLGIFAKPMLTKAAKSEDAEIRARALKLLAKLPQPKTKPVDLAKRRLDLIKKYTQTLPDGGTKFYACRRDGKVMLSWTGLERLDQSPSWYYAWLSEEDAATLPWIVEQLKFTLSEQQKRYGD